MLSRIFKNPKTNFVAMVSAIAGVLQAFHIYQMTPEQLGAVTLLLVSLLGFLSKDGDRGTSSELTKEDK